MVARTDIDRLERAISELTARVQRIEANGGETKREVTVVRNIALDNAAIVGDLKKDVEKVKAEIEEIKKVPPVRVGVDR